MNRSSALLLAFVFLSGCQALAPVSSDGTPPVEDSTPAPEKPKVYSSFSEETVFSLLTAELAGQRNRFDIALDNYVTQAINTQDPGISERAFRIAEYLGADQAALDTSLIWAKNAPDDLEAQRAAAIQLARAGRYDDSMAYMEKVLQGKGVHHRAAKAGLLQGINRLDGGASGRANVVLELARMLPCFQHHFGRA